MQLSVEIPKKNICMVKQVLQAVPIIPCHTYIPLDRAHFAVVRRLIH